MSKDKTIELIRRGQISRMHELSPDGLAWKPAEEFAELFPRVSPARTQTNVTQTNSSLPTGEAASKYYLQFNGRVVGPFSQEKATEMVRRGQISRIHQLSADGLSWRPAEEFTELYPKKVEIVQSRESSAEVTRSDESKTDIESEKVWFFHVNGENVGPISESELKLKFDSGLIGSSCLVWKDGMGEWLPLSQVHSAWTASKNEKWQGPSGVDDSLITQAWFRIVRSDFTKIMTTRKESWSLAKEGIEESHHASLNYIAWRKSVLTLCACFLTFSVLSHGYQVVDSIVSEAQTPGILKLIEILLFFVSVITLVICFSARLFWYRISISRLLARIAWYTHFCGPIIIFMIPFHKMFNINPDLQPAVGFVAAITIGGRVLGVAPGIVRCSLGLKTLLPETQLLGWLPAIVSPFQIMFFVIIAVIAIQTSQYLLSVGSLLLGISAAAVLINLRRIVAISTPQVASQNIASIRMFQVMFFLAGASVVGYYIVTKFSIELDASSVWKFAKAMAPLIGNVLLLSVVMSDFMLGIVYSNTAPVVGEGDEDWSVRLGERLEQLSSYGMTSFDAGERRLISELNSRRGIVNG